MDDGHALRERLRRTRAVCLALESAGGQLDDARVGAATHDLLVWLGERYPAEMGTLSRGGLDEMSIPAGSVGLMRELYAAAAVVDSLGVYRSADTFAEMDRDAIEVRTCLAEWRVVAEETAGRAPDVES